ncbi:hypothetical protein N431DRAFT_433053 [Stipitochalara longipes BDJ]|nr:hypothetical protein N431DRAFT_433053 [Stipitochalara longipes BDJ]
MADPGLGFEVPGQMYYLRPGINEPFHSITPAPKIEEHALAAVTKLLETYPLTDPPPTNRQHANPDRKSGIIELPLWQTTATVHPSSPHWSAYQTFIQAITPVVKSAGIMLSTYQKPKFDQARTLLLARNAAQDPSKCLPQYTPDNCFETLKLSANLALPPAPLTTSHCSPWIFVTLCGNWLGGDMDFGDMQGLPRMHSFSDGDVLVVRDGIAVGGKPFAGEKYQLELFLPDV